MVKNKQKKVFVAMSGGVDSSVAAALLKKQGYDVVGVFMVFETQIHTDGNTDLHRYDNRCCSQEAYEDARKVATKLNIPLYTFNLEKEFKKAVVDYFVNEYAAGRTPNPCVMCNKEIKFRLFLDKALAMGADMIATGHYARIMNYESLLRQDFGGQAGIKNTNKRINKFVNSKQIRYSLMVARDKNKDQNYFLWALGQEQLKYILFPIGDYTKPQVRKMAKKFGLFVSEKKDSQEVCFVKDADLRGFLKTRINADGKADGRGYEETQINTDKDTDLHRYGETQINIGKGPIVTTDGKKVGKHKGLAFYTIGQRKGIEIGGIGPFYVVEKNYKTNSLIVASGHDNDALCKKELIAENVNWISGIEPRLPLKVKAKIRYKHNVASAIITRTNTDYTDTHGHANNTYKITFSDAQRAITPGQSVVFYKGQEMLGGGVIE